jgi:hypothetical protein
VLLLWLYFVVSMSQSPLQNTLSCALSFWLEARYTKTCFRKPFVVHVCGDCVIDDTIHEWCQHDVMPPTSSEISNREVNRTFSLVSQ